MGDIPQTTMWVEGGGEHVGHIWGVARADEAEREGEKQMRKEEKRGEEKRGLDDGMEQFFP